ncbi:MAG: valine--tRNA ligase [Thermofilum sp. ex4484_15]|nr:MAG: valine--tRNA ligase [Thermofilum sp. ex4484_15]
MANFKPSLEDKRWRRKFEEELIKLWEKEKLYEFNPNSGKPIFSIDTPPPYASGKWHIGAAAHYSQIDMIARAHRMMGYEVLAPFYCDRNGLPVEVEVEKRYGVRPWEVPREKFLNLCKEFLDGVERELVRIVKRLGMSFQILSKGTDSYDYRKLTQATFIELFKKGLIYEDLRPNNYCPRCRTTLADAELEYKIEKSKLVYIKFKIKEGGEVIVATTRPELLPTCELIIFNPNDSRYQDLKGKHAIVPLFNKEVPILNHPSARMDFGTGLVMVCAFGDQNDLRIFRELKLPFRVAIDENGRMNEVAGRYKGLSVKEARRKIVEDLRKEGLIVKEEEIEHEVPVCWRCGTPIEYIPMKEYYLKQVEFKKEIVSIIETIKFYPEEYKSILMDWVKSITIDWPISRRRIYGTELPIWYCKKCGTPHLPPPGKYYRPWRDEPPFDRCTKCGFKEFKGEDRVLDTWMDSSISPLYIAGYLSDERKFRRVFPISLRPQGKDIIRTWLYYTILRIYQLTGKPAFKAVRITGMGLDEHGEKMSKSKGNVIDPLPVIEKYGADAVRFWSAAEVKLGGDYRFSEQKIATGAYFVTKLWNIARFVSSFPLIEHVPSLNLLDEALLSKLNEVISSVISSYKKYDVYGPAHTLFEFTWHLFADHYLEAIKPRAYNEEGKFLKEEQLSAWYTLHTTLKVILKLLAPIMPFVTDYIWRKVYSKGSSIHRELFPDKVEGVREEVKELLSPFIKFNSFIWKFKKSRGISLSLPLDFKVYVHKSLSGLKKDLVAMHKIKEIAFIEEKEVRVELGDGSYVSEAL